MSLENKALRDIVKAAEDFHNSQDIHMRTMLCVSALQTQITTLMVQRTKIMQAAGQQCVAIDDQIANIVRHLQENLKALDIIKSGDQV